MPSYRISLFEVKLIKLPIYESADDPLDLADELSAAITVTKFSLKNSYTWKKSRERKRTEDERERVD